MLGQPLTNISSMIPAVPSELGGNIPGLVMHQLDEDNWNARFNDNLTLIDYFLNYYLHSTVTVDRSASGDLGFMVAQNPIDRLVASWNIVKEDGTLQNALNEYLNNFSTWAGQARFETTDIEDDGFPAWTDGIIHGLPSGEFISFVRSTSEPYLGFYGWAELKYIDSYNYVDINIPKAPNKGFATLTELREYLEDSNNSQYITKSASVAVDSSIDIQPCDSGLNAGQYWSRITGYNWMCLDGPWDTESRDFYIPWRYKHDTSDAPDRLAYHIDIEGNEQSILWDKRWYSTIPNDPAFPVLKIERLTGNKEYKYDFPLAPMYKTADGVQLPSLANEILKKSMVYLARKLNAYHAKVYGSCWLYDQNLKTGANYIDEGTTGPLDNYQRTKDWPTTWRTDGETIAVAGYDTNGTTWTSPTSITTLLNKRIADFPNELDGYDYPGVMQLGQAFIQYLRSRIDYLGGRTRATGDKIGENYIYGGKLNRAMGWWRGNTNIPTRMPANPIDEYDTYYDDGTDALSDKWYQYVDAEVGALKDTGWRPLVRSWTRVTASETDALSGIVIDTDTAEVDLNATHSWDTGLDYTRIITPDVKSLYTGSDKILPGIRIYAQMRYRAFQDFIRESYMEDLPPGSQENFSLETIYDQFVPLFQKLHQLIGYPGKGYPNGWIVTDSTNDRYGRLQDVNESANEAIWDNKVVAWEMLNDLQAASPPPAPTFVDSVRDLIGGDWHDDNDRLGFDTNGNLVSIKHFTSLSALWRFHIHSVGSLQEGQVLWTDSPGPYIMNSVSWGTSDPSAFNQKSFQELLEGRLKNLVNTKMLPTNTHATQHWKLKDSLTSVTSGSDPHKVQYTQFVGGIATRYYQPTEGEDADATEGSTEIYGE